MSERSCETEQHPRIADFYNGKSVFITGAAGFVGEVLLEILLRTCPGIRLVYIHIREKKGVKPEQRKEMLLQKVIFDDLKADHPEALDKVRLVPGDISKTNLGMSEDDIERIIEDVSIVFHCAADVNFTKPLKFLMGVNAISTLTIVELCKKLKNLEALVFTSTFCSNCNRPEKIEEIVYRLPFPSERFFKEFRDGTEESLEALAKLCEPSWPNTYAFNKCLAENVVLENAAEVPSAIIRPSLVASTWKAPHPGFCEKNSVLILLCEGCGKGVIKVILIDPDKIVDYVPVDVVANCHVIAAWRVATQRCKVPYVVNCTSLGTLTETWGDFNSKLQTVTTAHPLPNTFRTPDHVLMTQSPWIYKIKTFYEHYVPAYAIDTFLKLAGKKPRMVRLYEFFDRAMLSTAFFTLKGVNTDTTNFRSMGDDLDEADKEIFYTDYSGANIDEMLEHIPTGNYLYDWKQDKRTKESRRKMADQRARFTLFVKYAFLIVMFTMVYFVMSTVYQLVW